MYKYHAPPPPPTLGPLADDDYSFAVASCERPYSSNAGNLVLPLKLTILPSGHTVFANPWTGTDKNGDSRDGIAEFLLCVSRAPREGEEPNWNSIVGARGRCRLKTIVAQAGKLAGKRVNVVGWFHRPEPEPGAQSQTFSKEEYAKLLKDKQAAARGNVVSGEEPDSIPF
jgi:hypothetical protein